MARALVEEVRHCPHCGGQRVVDVQTSRCLTCGRTPQPESVAPPPLDRSRFERPSPSRQYRPERPDAPLPELPEDEDSEDAIQARVAAIFDSVTVKHRCDCGAIIVWLERDQAPSACAWCRRPVA
jgi:hypothetical protein